MPVRRLTSVRAPRPLVAKLSDFRTWQGDSTESAAVPEYGSAVLRLGRLRSLAAVLTAIALLLQSSVAARAGASRRTSPTPADVVERMLALAKVGPSDVVYDLGCGDGRIVIAAAQRFGARGVGIDIDASLDRTGTGQRQGRLASSDA